MVFEKQLWYYRVTNLILLSLREEHTAEHRHEMSFLVGSLQVERAGAAGHCEDPT
jgi:hypothetical protein